MIRRVISAGTVGTILEWYDFNLYGLASALVLHRLFFPGGNPFLATVAAFATFAVGFLFRPLGGIIFGNYGDKLGRRKILMITLVLMGTATTLIGALPTYGQAGVLAPILLVLLRAVQGLGSGAEFAGAIVLTAEHSPAGRRGLFASLPAVGIGLGNILATGVFSLVSLLAPDQFLSWGWRLPFLASFVVVLVGLYVRNRVEETPVFERTRQAGAVARIPVLELLRSAPRPLLLTFVANFGPNLAGYIPSVFALTYLTQQVGTPGSVGLNALLVANIAGLVVTPLFGALCDRVGRRTVYGGGALLCAAVSFPFFWLLDSGSPLLVGAALLALMTIGDGALLGSQPALLAEAFAGRVRYSGIALSREFSAALIGGTAPLMATALLAAGGGSAWLVSTYMLALFVTAAVAARFIRADDTDSATAPA